MHKAAFYIRRSRVRNLITTEASIHRIRIGGSGKRYTNTQAFALNLNEELGLLHSDREDIEYEIDEETKAILTQHTFLNDM